MGLACANAESKDAIRAAVVELEKAGCVQRQISNKDRKFGFAECAIWDYPRPAAQLLSGNSMTGERSTSHRRQVILHKARKNFWEKLWNILDKTGT